MSKRTVFIAHPVGCDVLGNVAKILKICKEVHSDEIIPVVPYLGALQYLDDEVAEDRALGTDGNLECFRRGYIDELWLFGDRITNGMKEEIVLALELNIPIIFKTEETKRDFIVEFVLPGTVGAAEYKITLEDERAAQCGLTLEEWKTRGEELVSLYDQNQRAGEHPYKGMSDGDVEILRHYESWAAGGMCM